jgi:hypothetical protein
MTEDEQMDAMWASMSPQELARQEQNAEDLVRTDAMTTISEAEIAWRRAYIRKGVEGAFLAPPLEPQTEPERAMWHLERNARLVSATGQAAIGALHETFGADPSDAVLALVANEARPYFTNPYPGDTILGRASRPPAKLGVET